MQELQAESEKYNDLVLVDMIDSYRALPQKLRLFYRHLAEHVKYDYGKDRAIPSSALVL